MDPNAALAAIRQAVDALRDAENSPAVSRTQVVALVDSFRALDEWLSKGGFLPEAWRTEEVAALARVWDLVKPEPLGGPHPGVGGSHLPERDDDYTPAGMDDTA